MTNRYQLTQTCHRGGCYPIKLTCSKDIVGSVKGTNNRPRNCLVGCMLTRRTGLSDLCCVAMAAITCGSTRCCRFEASCVLRRKHAMFQLVLLIRLAQYFVRCLGSSSQGASRSSERCPWLGAVEAASPPYRLQILIGRHVHGILDRA